MSHLDGCGCVDCQRRHRAREAQKRYVQRLRDGQVTPRPRRPATASRTPREETPPAALAAVITTPALPDAACVGRWSEFDPAHPDEHPADVDRRHARAVTVCQRCPELTACRAWLLNLPATKRPSGVVAGLHITEKGTPDDHQPHP